MSAKFTDEFLLNAIEIISNGVLLTSFAKSNKVSVKKLRKELSERFSFKPTKYKNAQFARDQSKIIADRYANGESALALANEYGCSRQTINSICMNNGIAIRDGSKANRVRFSKLDAESLAEITKKARRQRINNLGKDAAENIRNIAIGKGENELFNILIANGFNPQRQLVVDDYAIDIAFGNIAVEIKFSSRKAFNVRDSAGDVKIIESGRHLVYIFINSPLAIVGARDEIIALLNFIGTKPASLSHYWVIRCNLDNVTFYDEINHVSLVDMSQDITTSIGKRHLS